MSPQPEWDTILQQISPQLGIPDWTWLDAVINNESSWNPVAVNPSSSAKGLIQFIDSTAQSLGFQSSLDLINQFPDVSSQLQGPVFNYFQKSMPYPTQQSLYMQVFYPAARNWSLSTAFPDSVTNANPGINTVGDYVNRVNLKAGIQGVVQAVENPFVSLPLILIAIGTWWFLTRKKH